MKTIHTITLGEYQELYQINKTETDDLEKSIGMVSVITGLPRWKVEEMPLKEFTKASSEIAQLFSIQLQEEKPKDKIKLEGKRYLVILNPRKLTTGQYIDLQHFSKGNLIENFHKILACLIVPKKLFKTGKYDATQHEIISEQIKGMLFQDVHSICVFFLKLWEVSIPVIQHFLNQELKERNLNLPIDQLISLTSYSDGFTMQKELQTMKE